MARSKYQISTSLAQKIIADIKDASGADANIMGEDGVIIASFDQKRVGTIHSGGRSIMAGETDEIAVTEEIALTMTGVKPGYNCVVKIDGVCTAVIGIRGDPVLMKPIARLAGIVLKEELVRCVEMKTRDDFIKSTELKISDIAELMKVLTLNGAIQASKLGTLGLPFKVVVAELRKLADQINSIVGGMNGERTAVKEESSL